MFELDVNFESGLSIFPGPMSISGIFRVKLGGKDGWLDVSQGEKRMLIDGELVPADSGRTFENVNPATEEVLGGVSDAAAADMHRAIDAARRAFDETDWSTNHAFGQRCLEQLQESLEGEREQLREELILEVGCPRMITNGPQLDWPLQDAIRWPAKHIDEYPWVTTMPDAIDPMGSGGSNIRQVWKEPVGVVGAITPWNFPIEVILNKVGQALATGNTMVLKPAPDTPWNATRLGRLVAEHTDIPAGVLNVVTSSDHLVGEELTLSPKVDLISFTGSTAVGQRIMEKGAATMKRLFLELGGKSATVVLDDADFGSALLAGLGVCYHAGQGCAIQTRMLLPRSRYTEGVEMLKAMFPTIPYGDPQRPDVIMGPLVSAKQRDRVLRLRRSWGRRGSGARRRRQAPRAPSQRMVCRADAVHRRHQLDDHRAGGDLRAGARRDCLRGRRRGADSE
jgi:aldehyde dehydrogenase (NAD+)